ncbi:hypothetical protein ACGFYY_32705 [Streptomyces sp. NPDC048331]|uniref:hypothetical protein n=1 Tax=Streptomyces sp. NPDC048331 TaxID=3365534 RepID=UPI0037179965
MSADFETELIRDFMTNFKVSEPTARKVTDLFLTIATSMPDADAEKEFQRIATEAVAQGEAWATEFVQAQFDRQLPAYRATYEQALASGLDPAAELVGAHHIAAEAAAEIVTLLTTGTTSITGTLPALREDPTTRPAFADIRCPRGVVTVTVDPAATKASATVTTEDTTGPAADAVRDSAVEAVGDLLTVTVPDLPGGGFSQTVTTRGGRTTVMQNVGTILTGESITGLTINADGSMTVGSITGARMSSGPSPVKVHVTLPVGSGLRMTTTNADLTVRGVLAALGFDTHNGGLRAETVGRIKVRGHNGGVEVGSVQEQADIQVHNGSVTITGYSGNAALLIGNNGGISLTATPAARGRIEARTHNGNIRLRGVAGRPELDVVTITHRGSVRTN